MDFLFHLLYFGIFCLISLLLILIFRVCFGGLYFLFFFYFCFFCLLCFFPSSLKGKEKELEVVGVRGCLRETRGRENHDQNILYKKVLVTLKEKIQGHP